MQREIILIFIIYICIIYNVFAIIRDYIDLYIYLYYI